MPSGFIASFPRLMVVASGALCGGLGVWAFLPGVEGSGRTGPSRTVVVDADAQNDPADLSRLVARLEKPGAD